MFKAGFIETWGRGYKKIREGFEASGMPMPKVQNFCGGVQVTIERTKFVQMLGATDNVGSDVRSNVGSLSVVQLTEKQRKMYELFIKDSFISAKQMSVV